MGFAIRYISAIRYPLLMLLNRCKHAYKNVVRWWWLYLLCIGIDLARASISTHSIHSYDITIVWFLCWALLGFVVLLAVRPSKRIKDLSYYWSYKYHFIVFCSYTALAWIIRAQVCSSSFPFIKIIVSLVTFLCVPYHTASTLYLSPFMIYLAFFLCDARCSVTASVKAVKNSVMVLYKTYGYSVLLFVLGMVIFIGIRDWVLHPLVLSVAHLFSLYTKDRFLYMVAEDLTKIIMIVPFTIANFLYIHQVYKKVEKYFLS